MALSYARKDENTNTIEKSSIEKSQKLFSGPPLNIDAQNLSDKDKQMLRSALIAELDAANLYEQMANATYNPNLKEVMLDIAREEKVHVGEFEQLLEELDIEHTHSLEEGRQEVQEKKQEMMLKRIGKSKKKKNH